MRRSTLLACLAAGMLGLAAHAEDFADVTPYRPSVSTPAQLPAPGQLELEAGGLATRTASERRDSLPYQLKLAFNSEWGVLLGGDAYVSMRDASGPRAQGFGDTSVTLKRAFVIDDATAFGLEFGPTLPTAPAAVGSGKTDWTVNSIYSQDIGKLHLDANLNQTRLGAPDPGASRMKTGASLAFSAPLDEHWSATAELSGTRNRGAASTAQLLAALSYAPTKKISLDAGFARGLNSASPDWSFFTGMVVPLARLW
jgi:hypothetical protein